MSIACVAMILLGGVVVLVGIRVRTLVPKHWPTVRGHWIGPALQFSPSRYAYRTPDGVERGGSTSVRVLWRSPLGGTCEVAYDPEDLSRSHPAQLRGNGTVLIIVGGCAAASGAVLLALALG